ncbi:diguanylate cyclase [Halomonas salina]|nr:diguanylate cyclase [Halomonas salina]
MMLPTSLGARLVIATVVPLLLVTAALAPIFVAQLQTRLDGARDAAATRLDAEYETLLHDMNESFNQVLAVAELPLLRRHLRDVHDGVAIYRQISTQTNLAQLSALLDTLTTHFGRYSRLVLIGVEGEELMSAGTRPLPHPTGVDHAHADYFREAMRQPARNLYVSPPRVGLSRAGAETGTTAVIDIATPVFGADGHRLGVLLFTLDWHYLTARLPHVVGEEAGVRAIMADASGRWLLPGVEDAIGFGDRLGKRYPELWRSLQSRSQGELPLEDELLRFRTHDMRTHHYRSEAGMIMTRPDTQPWRLGILVPRPTLSALLLGNPWQLLVIVLTYLLAVAVGVLWVLSLQRQHQLRRQAMAFSREAQRLAGEARQYADEVQDLYEHAPCGYHSLDADGRIVRINRTELGWLGLRADEVIGRRLYRDFVSPETRSAFQAAFRRVLGEEGEGSAECELLRADGTTLPVAIQATAQVTAEGFQYTRATVFDLRERKDLEARLEEQAMTDPLTGLGNRRYLMEQAALEMARARRGGMPLSLVAIDLDHFKRINDVHGHDVGDRVLQAFAETVREQLREGDVLCRMGGEEFVALLCDTDAEQAMVVAERLRRTVAETPVWTSTRIDDASSGASWLSYSASLGVARIDPAEASLTPAIKRADQALYAAKQAGRDRVHAQFEPAGD